MQDVLENEYYKKILNKTMIKDSAKNLLLENILQLLNKNTKDITYMSDGISICGIPSRDFNQLFGVCDWLPCKPLHEQTPETWEKIANVISN
jgi:hypothetical protein